MLCRRALSALVFRWLDIYLCWKIGILGAILNHKLPSRHSSLTDLVLTLYLLTYHDASLLPPLSLPTFAPSDPLPWQLLQLLVKYMTRTQPLASIAHALKMAACPAETLNPVYFFIQLDKGASLLKAPSPHRRVRETVPSYPVFRSPFCFARPHPSHHS